MIHRCVIDKKTFIATQTDEVLSLADVVVTDIQLDYLKESLSNVIDGSVEMKALEETTYAIADYIPPEALVLIETTFPPGITKQIAYPIMKKQLIKRGIETEPLFAHSYERVMPGRDYVTSVRDLWQVCSSVNQTARNRLK